ncbi:type IV toxin-antitoxin system AbiEi family antitoxin domain-containing protein [Microbacterium cremeum]|uniref:type IV toxin-antitoxin system AbiEi family antitoxin domain-containing protein n=1 Tax=Microbacterium cremeum TaxID=2782169 RepID=UPI001E527FA1|nr:type IV toxin-antitoxin system AbiEi family antitoxin domain-containing protein [Microbacterium cremeum]
MNEPRDLVSDGIASMLLSTSALAAAGMSRRELARMVAAGRLIRVRKGWHVQAGTHPTLVSVARLGGRRDCVSLLRHLGVFVLQKERTHMQLDPLASRVPRRPDGVVRHWRPTSVPREALVTDVVEALVQAVRCQEPRAAIATLDSAWHLGIVGEEDIAEVFSRLPRRYRRLRGLLDRRSESGPETLVRLMLRAQGCRVEVQRPIAGVGRVDFLVDGWLIIECDSQEFHSSWTAQKRDRRRDLEAARLGYTTLRLLAEDIMWNRELVHSALKDVIARGRGPHGVRNS